jgi:predicted kinase
MYKNLSDKLANLTREFNKEKMNMEIELKSNLQKGDAEVALLNNKLQTVQKIFEKQKEDIEKTHQKEILEIEDKIMKTLKIKEDIIQSLQSEVETKEITIKKYEEMLNQQRKEFFGS